MNIFVTGDAQRREAFKQSVKIGLELILWHEEPELPGPEKLQGYDLIIDLNLDESQENLETYAGLKGAVVLGCAVKMSLAQMVSTLPVELQCMLGGINALPGFIERLLTEVSAFRPENRPAIEKALTTLGLKASWVEDRVGMVTPRILFMIINEAYYTVQEGTASAEDIDLSMKLGTNYPYGPFEWSRKIGIRNIYGTLEALYQDTHEERYKICPMLKREYLMATAIA
jgi:3-hydroxybutyryl-CoA dehydrogenase